MSFGVSSGKFLGYLISKRGIEVNPDKITALLEIPSLKTHKEVQKLTGRVAALSRFISRSTDKCLPFFSLLRKNKSISWDEKCQKAFKELKRYLSRPPMLCSPVPGDELMMYLAVSTHAVSAVLVKEEEKSQKPIFYTSKSLLKAEARYTKIEKFLLSLVTSSRKLCPYFEAHAIKVMSKFPIRSTLKKLEKSGRMIKWGIEMWAYDINYLPLTSRKALILANFIVGDFGKEMAIVSNFDEEWILRVDGSSSMKGSRAKILLVSPDGTKIEKAISFTFQASNNEAECEALILCLQTAKELDVRLLCMERDSHLIVNQTNGEYETRDERMKKYQARVQAKLSWFKKVVVRRIPRTENGRADALASLGSSSKVFQRRFVLIEVPKQRSIEVKEALSVGEPQPTWMTPIKEYLHSAVEPEEKTQLKNYGKKLPDTG